MPDVTYKNLLGETVTVKGRGKHYVQPRGYVQQPGTGPEGETCGSCKHHVGVRLAKTYHKCGLARGIWTGGRGSDIIVKSPACNKWEKQNEGT